MFLNPDTQECVDTLIWHSLPDESSRALQRWQIGSLVGILYKNPPTRSPESLVAIPSPWWSSAAGRRSSSSRWRWRTCVPLPCTSAVRFDSCRRSIRRGSFAPCTATGTPVSSVVLGPYTGGLSSEEAIAFLLEAALDIFDLVDDPQLLEGEDKASR